MAGTVGTVFVKVVPEARDFQRELQRHINMADFDRLGQQIGRRLTPEVARGIGRGVQVGVAGAMNSRRAQTAATQVGRAYGAHMGTTAAASFVQANGAALQAHAKSPAGKKSAQSAGATAGAAYVAGAKKQFAKTGSQKMAGPSEKGLAGVLPFTLPQNSAFASMSTSLALAGGRWQRYALPVAAAGAATLAATAAIAGSAVALRAVAGATMSAYQIAGQYEGTITGLTTLMGDAAAGQEMFYKTAEFAKQTPFEFQQVSAAVRQLKAYGFAANDLLPILTDIGDAASSLSLGPEGVQRIIMAMGQIKARGVFGGDEARQLTEAGIPAWKYLARAISEAEDRTVTVGEVMKMAEARTIDAGFALKALREGMQGTFGGGMQAQAATLLGTISTLKDSLQVSMGTSLQASLKPLSGMLQGLMDPLDGLSRSIGSALGPAVTTFAEVVVPALSSFFETASPIVSNAIADLGPKLAKGAESFVSGLEKALPLVEGIASAWGDSLVVMGGAVDLLGSAAAGLGKVPDWMKSLAGLIPVIGPALSSSGVLSSFADLLIGTDQTEALNKIKTFGIAAAGQLEAVFTQSQLGKIGINAEALKVGDVDELLKVASWSDAELQVRLGIPADGIQKFREELQAAITAVEGDVPLTLSTETKAVTRSAEKALATAAAKVSTDQKAAVKLGIDPVLLQSGDAGQIENLLALDDKTLKAKFGIDASEIRPALQDFQAMQRYLNDDYTINVGVAADDAAQITDQIKSWTSGAGTKKALIKFGVDPGSLAALQPAAIQKLAGKPKLLAELGVKDPGGFRSKVKALLGVAGGRSLTAVAKLKADTSNVKAQVDEAVAAWESAKFKKQKLEADASPVRQQVDLARSSWESWTPAAKTLTVNVRASGRTDLVTDGGVPFGSAPSAAPPETAGGIAGYSTPATISMSSARKPITLPTAEQMSKMGDKAKAAAKKRVDAIREFYRQAVEAAMQGERRINRQTVDQMDQGVRDLIDVAVFDQNEYTKPVRAKIRAIGKAYRDETAAARRKLRQLDKGREMRDDIESRMLSTVDLNATTNPALLTRNLNKSATAMKTYAANISTLKSKYGASDGLVEALGQMDAEQAAKLTQRLLADPSQIAALKDAYASYASGAFQVGNKVSGAVYNLGKQSGKGLSKGLEAQEPELLKTIERLGKAGLKKLRETLGIKSPSKEFAKIGVNVVDGLVAGIGKQQANADAAVAALVSAPSYRLPGPGPGAGSGVHIEVHPARGQSEMEVARQTAREFAWMM